MPYKFNPLTHKFDLVVDASTLDLNTSDDTQVLFDDDGTIGGDSTFIFNKITKLLSTQDLSISGSIITIDSIQFDLAAEYEVGVGELAWNADENTLDLGMEGGVVGQINHETFYPVAINQTGSHISEGAFVQFAGAVGASGKVLITPRVADGSVSVERSMGVVTNTGGIANGAEGTIAWFGKVRGTDTSGTYLTLQDSIDEVNFQTWSDGNILYPNPDWDGHFTNIKPSAPNDKSPIAAVINAHTNGTILVRPHLIPKFTDLSDVNGTPVVTTGQLPVWDQVGKYFDFNYNILDYQLKDDFTQGSILFRGAIEIDEDNSNFFWDDINNRLGIGTGNPQGTFDLVGQFLLMGADFKAGVPPPDSNTRTDNTTKVLGMVSPHYKNSEEEFVFFRAACTATGNLVEFGGGTGAFNISTQQRFWAGPTNTTLGGLVAQEQMRIVYGGVGIGTQAAPGAQLEVETRSPSRVATIIKGAPAQSVDLVRIKDSGNNNLVIVDKDGGVLITGLTASQPVWTDAGKKLVSKAINVDINYPISMYDAQPARGSETNWHGGILSLATGQPLDSDPTDIVVTKGIGKLMIVVNAGSDFNGDIIITGTSVDRDTGAVTPADADTITIDSLTTDGTTTDANGNTVHAFTGAYVSSKWFEGTVTLSTTNLTLTDVDVYHLSFEQNNDDSDLTLTTFDANIFTTNVNAEFDAYIYTIHVTGSKCDIHNEASLHIGAVGLPALANRYERLRRGNIDDPIDGTTDGWWVDIHYSNSPSYVEDMTMTVWFTKSQIAY